MAAFSPASANWEDRLPWTTIRPEDWPEPAKRRCLRAFFHQLSACWAASTTRDEKRPWAAEVGERGFHGGTGHFGTASG